MPVGDAMYERLLNPTKGLIFRILHRAHLPWVLDNGLHCQSSGIRDPAFVQIGNPDLIAKRAGRPVPCSPGGMLNDYVAFYFTPFSPMMLNIRTGHAGLAKRNNEEIVMVVSSIPTLREKGVPFLFTDSHAYLLTTEFFDDPARLDRIDWPQLQRRDFRRRQDDPMRFDRYQAEALVHRHMPVEAMLGVVCHGRQAADTIEAEIRSREMSLRCVVQPSWYFE